MVNTYSQIYIQIIFAVKGRQNLIAKNNRLELHKYIGGIVKRRNQKRFAIFAMLDIIHMLVSLDPNISISDLVRDVKSGPSKFITDKGWVGKFNCQLGFGAFSYLKSQVDTVVKYILNQENHLKKSRHLKKNLSGYLIGLVWSIMTNFYLIGMRINSHLMYRAKDRRYSDFFNRECAGLTLFSQGKYQSERGVPHSLVTLFRCDVPTKSYYL